MAEADMTQPRRELTSAELGALAHLYRGEIYRSTVWRTRLDTSTNWAVVTLGVALSITFSSPSASPLPLVLVGILILLFLMLSRVDIGISTSGVPGRGGLKSISMSRC